ncbi:uncharacterized protein LOC119563239 [Drosophila subpulchrella]|uniref:uncharacterized protein LOC119563239 n=1 Tax=Drosophila subpulchrella TaxID=1486046 RepID=UPI0018A14A39|nr:uncharacterized protein LOC119563239 [Drosophila subpulchrella]
MVVTLGAAPQKKTGRVAPRSTPLAGRTRSVGLKRAAAGALTTLAGGPPLGLVNGTDRDGFSLQIATAKAQATAARTGHPAPSPPPRPYRRAGAAAAAASAAAASAAVKFAAKVPGAPVVGAVSQSISSNLTLPSSAVKKSSLASRKVGGGKATDPSIKRRVKFSANVHTYPSVTSTKKTARIGELQLKKKVKKLKRIRSRREGGTASDLLNSSGIATSNQEDIYKHGIIVDVESLKAPAPPRVLRLNVVRKSSPATGKSALATALLRKAKRSAAAQEKAKEPVTAVGRSGKAKTKATGKSGGSSTKNLLGSSSLSVESSANLAGRKKLATGTTGIQRRSQAQPQHGRRIYGKV